MGASERFDQYMEHLSAGVWHLDRQRRAQGLLHGSDAAAGAQERRAYSGVPEDLRLSTQTQIPLSMRALLAEGAPRHCVLADAGYVLDTAFRQALSDMGLQYAVACDFGGGGLAPSIEPLLPKHYSGVGLPPVMPGRPARCQPMSVKALALSLPTQAFHTISWREGTNEPLNGRIARAARATPRRQCRQGTLASPAVAAHRVACT